MSEFAAEVVAGAALGMVPALLHLAGIGLQPAWRRDEQ